MIEENEMASRFLHPRSRRVINEYRATSNTSGYRPMVSSITYDYVVVMEGLMHVGLKKVRKKSRFHGPYMVVACNPSNIILRIQVHIIEYCLHYNW